MRLLIALGFLGGYMLSGCAKAEQEPSASVKNVPAEAYLTDSTAGTTTLEALSADEAEKFVKRWCGSNALTNFRQLDAAEYLLSAEMPSWLHTDRKAFDALTELDDPEVHEQVGQERRKNQKALIKFLKDNPNWNAMLPTGKMILADFSSGNDCRNTLVVVDALAAAYLKRLADASSANAFTCKRKSKDGFHRLAVHSPVIMKALGAKDELHDEDADGLPERCSAKLALAFVGHASFGTLTVSAVINNRLNEEPEMFAFELKSYILEADGSAQFLRPDGASKIVHRNFTTLFR